MSVTHFHGTPIWGNKGEVLNVCVRDGGAFVSFARPDQIERCLKVCKEMGIDNGAFSHWVSGLEIDWERDFYPWLLRYVFHPKVTFFVIPDVIEGTEEENDRLIDSVPAMFRAKAVPVWHLHESIDRLVRLCKQWPRVAFGSSGEYAAIRTKAWHRRMTEAFEAIRGIDVKIHGLRMLDGRVLGNYPLDTADSTNLASNIPKWVAKYHRIGQHILMRSSTYMTLVDMYGLDKVHSHIMHYCMLTLKSGEVRLTPVDDAVMYISKVYSVGDTKEAIKQGLKKHSKGAHTQIISEVDKGELLIHRAAVLRGAIESVTPPPRENRDVCCHAKGAYITHRTRVDATEQKITAVILAFRQCGKKITKSAVARETGMSREQLSRRYQHLFAA